MVTKHAIYMRTWRKKHEKSWKEYMFKWKSKNKNRIKKQRKEWYLAHRNQEIISAILRQKKNPLYTKAAGMAIHANKKYSPHLKVLTVLEVIKESNFICCWCGKKELFAEELTLEHLKPINIKKFLRIACRYCNSARIHLTNGQRKTKEEKRQGDRRRWKNWYKKHGVEAGKKYREEHRDKLRVYQREYMPKRRDKRKFTKVL